MKLYIDNFKTYWKEHIIHILVGAWAGYLASDLETAALGAVIMTTVAVRQGLEFAKRKDTPWHRSGISPDRPVWGAEWWDCYYDRNLLTAPN